MVKRIGGHDVRCPDNRRPRTRRRASARLHHRKAERHALVGGARSRGRTGVPHGVPVRGTGGGAATDLLTRYQGVLGRIISSGDRPS